MSRQPGTGVPLAGLRRTNFYGNQPWLRNPAARCTRPPQIVAQRAPANSTVCAELPLAKSAPRKLLQQRFDFLPTPTTHRTHPLSSPHSITPSPDVVGRTNTLDWAEAQGLPDWMPEILASFRQQYQWPDAAWRDVYRSYIVMFTPRADRVFKLDPDRVESEADKQLTLFAVMVDGYKQIEPRPAFRKRNPDISQWASDDPLEPLARAAIEALADLETGVRVRDSAINAYGVVPYSADVEVVDEPAVAGLGVGDMINCAPEESVEIYQLAHALGDGDVKTGLSKILRLAGGYPIP